MVSKDVLDGIGEINAIVPDAASYMEAGAKTIGDHLELSWDIIL